MLKRFMVMALALVALAAFAAACATDEDDDDEQRVVRSALTPTPAAPVPLYPLTVTDLLGREVIIVAEPLQIVTTSPSALEILYAAGGQAVARSETALHPMEASDLPSVGPSYAPAFESIVQLEPDLVIADASAQAHLAQAFEATLGDVPIVFLGALKYEDVATSLRLVGGIIDRREQAEAAAVLMEEVALELAGEAARREPPRVLIVNGAVDDFFVALPDSFVGDLVAMLGGENVAAGQPPVGQFPGYTRLSLEQIVAADPQLVIAITAGPPGGPTLAETLLASGLFGAASAVLDGRVHDVDVEVFLQAPGPRAAGGLQLLFDLLYPPEQGDAADEG